MAELKPRAKTPSYEMAKTDFIVLEQKHQHYNDYFFNHQIYPETKYWKEVERIKSEWQNNPIAGGGRSLEKSLEELSFAHSQVKNKEILHRSIINQLFGQVYGYFHEMVVDNSIGYLEDDLMLIYIQEYDNAIKRNKSLNLDSWNNKIAEEIEKEIAGLLKTQNK